MKCWYCLVVSIQRPCTLRVRSPRRATLDDYIADFQAGFFKRMERYRLVVHYYRTRGNRLRERGDVAARSSELVAINNVPHAPTSWTFGTALIDYRGWVEWVPFSQPNKDIDFENLFKQVDKVDTRHLKCKVHERHDTTYANAQVKQVFAENVVDPSLLRTQLTHELNSNYWRYGHSYYLRVRYPASSTRSAHEADDIRINSILKLGGYKVPIASSISGLNCRTT